MTDERLTDHFFLSEFTRSETAARLGIPMKPSTEVLSNIRLNAAGMEMVRDVLKAPVLISSGYRPEGLEMVLCAHDYETWCTGKRLKPSPDSWQIYFARKRHPLGLATDFTAPAFGPPAKVCRAIEQSDIRFDQLIFEIDWCHISWLPGSAPRKAKREVLTLVAGGYVPGILETSQRV
jgi:zinc D-Ala-D-Ala carboxypeptidase